jgi:isoquinoline 1-oxidoreductase beta subunit
MELDHPDTQDVLATHDRAYPHLPPPDEGVTISRRMFMNVSAGVGAGLMLGVVDSGAQMPPRVDGGRPAAPALLPHAYVRIAPNGKITLFAKNPEIGQGIKTGFALILAEELDANWADVVVEQSAVDAAIYGAQSAGGSRSVASSWTSLRQAGAGARAMLVAAAARQWNVPIAEIVTESSVVRHATSQRTATYGSLASAAANVPVPAIDGLKLKSKSEFKLLGKRYTGVDNQKLVHGQPLFGIDVVVANMRIAAFQKCSTIYGKVQSVNLDEIKRLPGVINAFVVDGTGKPAEVLNGVAIIAEDTWSALSAKRQLEITWDLSSASTDSWTAHSAEAKRLSGNLVGEQVVRSVGDVEAALNTGRTVGAYYTYGLVAHAQLEPINCTAWYKRDPAGDSLEIWAPTQTPNAAQTLAANLMGLPSSRVTVHQTRVGGGFGRRLNNDYVAEASQISRQAGGIPIQLIWTREDDMEHDFVRPAGFMAFTGALDGEGRLSGWNSHIVHFRSEGGTAVTAANWQAGEFPAGHLPAYRASQTFLPLRIPTGSWRAPGAATAAWVVQSFMHELSIAAKRDHAEFLSEVVSMTAPTDPQAVRSGGGGLDPERSRNVIKAVAERAGWNKRRLPKGRALGIAFHYSHSGHFAEVAEVSVDVARKVTVHKVWVVGDVGPVVNLSSAEAQCQGAVIDGLGAMVLEVTVENGQIEQKNFHQYPLRRITDTPEVDVHFLDTDYPPTGIGEPALPPLAPAVCNAIQALTGHRIRTLPITKEGYSL